MFSLRNGSLFANALLVAIGAAAGAGVTVLLTPLLSDTEMRSGRRDAVSGGSPERGHALTPAPGGSSGSEEKDGAQCLIKSVDSPIVPAAVGKLSVKFPLN